MSQRMFTFGKAKNVCKKYAKGKFPIVSWLPVYSVAKLQCDLIAGLAVGLMTVAHGFALGTIAGLPVQYGLYSAYPAGIVYFFLGTAKDMHIGPTVLQALLTLRYVPTADPVVASILAFCSGLVMFIIGILNLGKLMNFISYPVVGGFVSAAAIVITISQWKYLFGIPYCPRQTFPCLVHLFKNVEHIKVAELAIGMSALIILTVLQLCVRFVSRPLPSHTSRWRSVVRKMLWFLVVARSAVVPICSMLLSYAVTAAGHGKVFITPGFVPKGIPPPTFPLVEVEMPGNTTTSPLNVITGFSSGIIIVPLLAILEHIAVAKSLSTQNKYMFDSSQELVAIGVGNMFGSFFRAFPVTGSFGRSAVNSASGAATPVTGLVTSSIVLLTLLLIAPIFVHIPLAVLAAVVISACLSMIDIRLPFQIWKTNREDMIPYLVGFAVSFYEIEYGILAGIAISLIMLLRQQMRPNIELNQIAMGDGIVSSVKVSGSLSFPAAENVILSINKELLGTSKVMAILVDCKGLNHVDYTVFKMFQELKWKQTSDGKDVVFINCETDPALRTLMNDTDYKRYMLDDSLEKSVPMEDKVPLLDRETNV